MSSGTCRDCCDDNDCPTNQVCINGECQNVGCRITTDCDTGEYCCNNLCVIQNEGENNECCIADDCNTNRCCPVCVPSDEQCDILEGRCVNGDCCGDADCSEFYYCDEFTCTGGCSNCQITGACIETLIDKGFTNVSYNFDTLQLGDMDVNDVTLELDGGATLRPCIVPNDSECQDDCSDVCLNRFLSRIYNIFYCYNGNCYRIVIYVPLFYENGTDNYYGIAKDEFDTLVCDSINNSTVVDETQLKCTNTTCNYSTVDTDDTCQRIEGVSNADLPLQFIILEYAGQSVCAPNCGGTTTPSC